MFLLAFTLAFALAAGNVWADSVTGLTTFTSGTKAYADSVNANFSEIENSVNDNYSKLQNTKILPDGVSTILSGIVSIPKGVDTTFVASTWFHIYLSGCSGSNVRMGFYAYELELGNNLNTVHTWSYSDLAMPVANVNSTVVGRASFSKAPTNFDDDALLRFAIRRDGASANDTCSSDATLLGVKIEFWVTGIGQLSVWVPPSDLD